MPGRTQPWCGFTRWVDARRPLFHEGVIMDTLNRELEHLVDEVAPPLVDIAQLERLVTEDDLLMFDGECTLHDGCRAVLDSRR